MMFIDLKSFSFTHRIKKPKQFLYATMLIEGTLNSYLADIDRQAQEHLLLLTKQITDHENVTEQLKADNAMLWVQEMNEGASKFLAYRSCLLKSKTNNYRLCQYSYCSVHQYH